MRRILRFGKKLIANVISFYYRRHLRTQSPLKICLGCNRSMRSVGWYSVDCAGRADILDDAGTLKKIPDGTCETIIASHILEHMAYYGWGKERVEKAMQVLSLWSNKLLPGGKLLIAVPDMDWILEVLVQYQNSYWNLDHTPFKDIVGSIYGGMENKFNCHGMLFNLSCLKYCLERAGFNNIEKIRDPGVFLLDYNASAGNIGSLNVIAYKTG